MTDFDPLKFGIPQFAPTEDNSVNEQCGDEAKTFRQAALVMLEVADRLVEEGDLWKGSWTRAKVARLARYAAHYYRAAAARTIGHKKTDMWLGFEREMLKLAEAQEAQAVEEQEEARAKKEG